jgi:leucyl aminopeptidase
MDISIQFNVTTASEQEIIVVGAFQKKTTKGKKEEKSAITSTWPTEYQITYKELNTGHHFDGSAGQSYSFDFDGQRILAIGLGEKSKLNDEGLRKAIANMLKSQHKTVSSIGINLDTMLVKGGLDRTAYLVTESLVLTNYLCHDYKTAPNPIKLEGVTLETKTKKSAGKKAEAAVDSAIKVADSVNLCRDLVNAPPNELHSESYAKRIEADVKKNLKRVKVKILGKPELKKEKMGMFLSVNSASNYQPRLVHLTYTPAKKTKNTKHIAFVGKGLTFDSGGYSLKPSKSMVNMKFDMGGSATVYAAFRAAVLLELPVQISCFLGMTDNAVNNQATYPDSIVTARNGKTVEILNTDAEGRLVLGDVLSYASDLKPNAIIDAATLTGACLVALGTEVCGLMGNDEKLKDKLEKAAKATDEYIWQLPIIQEWRDDMKSPIADLQNIGKSGFGGTAKAAAFLENFVGEGISWAHLDIAGCGDSQSHLPYCPSKGGSGIMVRTLVEYLKSV